MQSDKRQRQSNFTITPDGRPIELEECRDFTITAGQIRGGLNNLSLRACSKFQITGTKLFDPARPPNSDSGKHILLDDCHDFSLSHLACSTLLPTGDGINLYRCTNATLDNLLIQGPKIQCASDRAAPLVLDKDSANITLFNLQIRPLDPDRKLQTLLANAGQLPPLRVGITLACKGPATLSNITILNVLDAGLQIDGSIYNTLIQNITITCVTVTPKPGATVTPVWWHPKWTRGLVIDGKARA